jgi:DnaJ-class molecular chaperone
MMSMKKPMQCHYVTLGVDLNASKKDLKLAYYNLAKKFHPDSLDHREFNEAFTADMFKLVSEAYEVR